MLRWAHGGGQAHWNHCPSQKEPQLQTSRHLSESGGQESKSYYRNKLSPFQSVRKVCHQQRLEWNSMFSLVWKYNFLNLASVAYICATKVLPHLTTFVACYRDPTKERYSCYFASVQPTHSATSLTSFSCGNLASILILSKMITRKGRAGSGPSTFSKASGTPR